MSKTNKHFAWYGLSLVGLFLTGVVLAACGTVNQNSTIVSQTIRPVTVVEGANNNVTQGTLPTDPTKSPELAAGVTSTPGRATATPARPAPTTAGTGGGNTPAAGGTTPPAGATPGTGGGAVNVAQATSAFRRLCLQCHPANGANAGIGPALRGPFTNDPASIIGIVRNGRGSMPKFTTSQISDADLDNMARWIKGLYHP
jgi:mono/diheme cytochrome c family protein